METKREYCACDSCIQKPAPHENRLRTRYGYFSLVLFMQTGRLFLYMNENREIVCVNAFRKNKDKEIYNYYLGLYMGKISGRPYSKAVFEQKDRLPDIVGMWMKKEVNTINMYHEIMLGRRKKLSRK